MGTPLAEVVPLAQKECRTVTALSQPVSLALTGPVNVLAPLWEISVEHCHLRDLADNALVCSTAVVRCASVATPSGSAHSSKVEHGHVQHAAEQEASRQQMRHAAHDSDDIAIAVTCT